MLRSAAVRLAAILFVVIYPALVAIYQVLPLFIGFFGFLLFDGIEKNRVFTILLAIVYLIHIETDLHLPYFLSIMASLIAFLLLYGKLGFLKECRLCRSLVATVVIDAIYFGLLLGYDALFGAETLKATFLYGYSAIIDLVAVVFL